MKLGVNIKERGKGGVMRISTQKHTPEHLFIHPRNIQKIPSLHLASGDTQSMVCGRKVENV